MPNSVFLVAVIGALLGGPFLYGFNTAVINTPADAIKLFCIEVYMARQGENFSEFFDYVKATGKFPSSVQVSNGSETVNQTSSQKSANQSLLSDKDTQLFIVKNAHQLLQAASLTTFWSVTVAVYVVGGMVGAFLSGTVADRLGRRSGMLVNLSFSAIGIACESAAKYLRVPELLPIGRALVGFSCSIGVALGAMYLTEISPRQQRGQVGTSVQLGVMTGVLFGQLVGLSVVFGNSELWPLCFASAVVPLVVSVATLPFVPESPRYLSITRRLDDFARLALVRLRGREEAEAELRELLSERDELLKNEGIDTTYVSSWKILTSKQYSLPIFLAVWLYFVQQWSGINAILAYSETMFKSVDIPAEYIQYAVLSTGVVSILSCFFAIGYSEKIGRRRVMIYPTFAMSILMILFAAIIIWKDISPVLKYVSLVIFLLYVAGFNLGCGTVPAFFVNEVFRQNSRGSATTIAQISHWLNSALVVYSFPYIAIALKEYTYLLYAGILLLSGVLFVFYMPETSGLSVNLLARMLSFGFKAPVFNLSKQFASEIQSDKNNACAVDQAIDQENIALSAISGSDQL